MTLSEFIEYAENLWMGTGGPPVARWVLEPKMKAYCRYGAIHRIQEMTYRTFDVASVEVMADWRGQGVFSDFLNRVEEVSPFPVFVENVQTDRLRAFLRKKRGYTVVGMSMFKTLNRGENATS